MLQSSKLSNRFKSTENDDIIKDKPKKFVFSKNQINQQNLSNDLDNEKTIIEEQISERVLDIDFEAELKKALLEKIDSIPVWFEYTADKQKELIKSFVENKLSSEAIKLADNEKDDLIEKLFTSIMGFGPLDYLIVQENVDAIYVNGINSVHIEINGKILNTEMKLNEKQINFILSNISSMSGIKFDGSKNIWDCKVNNLVITIIMPKICQSGYNITIRKSCDFDIDKLIHNDMASKEIIDFIVLMVNSKKNIVISGDINSGKTTFLDVLLKTTLKDKRAILLENASTISADFNTLMKFSIDKHLDDYYLLLSNILKMSPEYILSDLNFVIPELSDIKGNISTLRASSIDNALSKLISSVISADNISEKYAKAKVLTNFDYIIQLNRMNDGVRRITSVVELTPARTAALSVKVIAKYEDGKYVTEIPQPLTSIRAESLLSEAGSMSSRFYHSDL